MNEVYFLRAVRHFFWYPFVDQRRRFEYQLLEHISFQAVMLPVVPVCLFVSRNDLWRRRATFLLRQGHYR